MEIEIIRSKRKTLSIQIGEGGKIIARAPMRLKDEKIYKFVQQKSQWIQKTLDKMAAKKQFEGTFDFAHNLYLLGKSEPVANFNLGIDGNAKSGDGHLVYDKIYRDFAKKLLPKRTAEIAKRCGGMEYKAVKITSSKRYWGLYNKNGNISLNYKLVVLPEQVIEYVIIHELCHSKQLNHSKRFWQLVGTFEPEYKQLKKVLDDYSFLL